jgi:hypothetical protein
LSESVTVSDDEQLVDVDGWPKKRDGEVVLTGPADLLLWRQVHEDHVSKDGIVDNIAFAEVVGMAAMRGTPNARDEVSMSRGDRLSAQEAFEDWLGRGGSSYGTFGITIDEVIGSECRTIDDSARLDSESAVPGHVFVDLRKHPESPKHVKRRIRSMLAAYATFRQRQYPPVS